MHTILLQSKNIPSIVHLYKELYGETNNIVKFESSSRFCLKLSCGTTLEGLDTVLRFLSKNLSDEQRLKMIGSYSSNMDVSSEAQIDYWTNKMYSHPSKLKDVILNEVVKQFKTDYQYFLGDRVSLIDIYLRLVLHDNPKLLNEMKKVDKKGLVDKWIDNCLKNDFLRQFIIKSNNANSDEELKSKKGALPDLPGAIVGQVVTRFPPEASGYLHIGHAKAALLNQLYKEKYNGKLVMRFDDTNPSKENEQFEQVILDDIRLLGLKPDTYTRTSDHFHTLMQYAKQLILSGDAFCDDTSAEEMKNERLNKLPSKCRNNSVEKNLQMWDEMVKGTDIGQTYCLRAKIDHTSLNGCMRDPTIYRCKQEPHLVTKDKFKCYPTYDFACPIVDSIENVTHALRTSEYVDRDQQYYWFISKLKIPKPSICSFSRLNLKYTLLSKRKLTWLVNNGIVEGWDDPRLPTVRGLLRRGLELDALKNFIVSQGFSKNINNMDPSTIWAINKQILESTAHRFSALKSDGLVEAIIDNFKSCKIESTSELPLIASDPQSGNKTAYYSSSIWLEKDDVSCMNVNDKITLFSLGNAVVKMIKPIEQSSSNTHKIHLELCPQDKSYKGTLKVTWLPVKFSSTENLNTNAGITNVKLEAIYYSSILKKPFLKEFDNFEDFVESDSELIVPMKGENALMNVQVGQKIQILRKGFFICDKIVDMGSEKVFRLLNIPDGSKSCFDAETAKSQTNVESRPLANDNCINGENLSNVEESNLEKLIMDQGNKVRDLKSNKATPKDVIKLEVDKLLNLKKRYQQQTGQPYKSSNNKAASKLIVSETSQLMSKDHADLHSQITKQGTKIRQLKLSKAEKAIIDKEVKVLLALKETYKINTGFEYKPPVQTSNVATFNANVFPSKKELNPNLCKKSPSVEVPTAKKVTKLGLEFKKDGNFSKWYSELIVKGGLIEYYDIGGCYVLRPQAYGIWEKIQSFMDCEFKTRGIKNCYFPMFVSKAALNKEQQHIEDFSPEVAWVTKSGNSELQEPIAIRPTSETVMYPAYAKWIQSHRDLPLKLNQWCNVVRWEFKHPTPFLRSREFLWQEGHTAYATKDEAVAEVYDMLDIYKRTYEELLAVPVIKGRKTEKEKFPGGDFTTTVEAYIPNSGRGIQAATSHHLGQNFSKMFEIIFEDPKNNKAYAYQNSWGFTTRSIGVSIMIHSDNNGLVLPPRVVDTQVVIIPCGITSNLETSKKEQIFNYCNQLNQQLIDKNIRSVLDTRDNLSPGWKFNHYEMKGTPLRVEIGPKEMESSTFVVCRRDTFEKIVFEDSNIFARVCQDMLETVQQSLLEKARKKLNDNVVIVENWDSFMNELNKGKLLLTPFCLEPTCESQIKDNSSKEDETAKNGDSLDTTVAASMGAKSLCIPFDQPKPLASNTNCINPICSKRAVSYVLFGRSY